MHANNKKPGATFAESRFLYTSILNDEEILSFAKLSPTQIEKVKNVLDGLERDNKSPYIKRKQVTFFKLKDEDGQAHYCAKYKGAKHGKLLGVGSRSRVKLIRDIESQIWYAAKIRNLEEDTDVSRFQQELHNLSIVGKTIGGLTRSDGKPQHIIGMEYVPGETLDKFCLRQEKLRLNADPTRLQDAGWIKIIENMADKTANLFAAGLIHRDIKLQNFIVDPDSLLLELIDLDVALPYQKGKRSDVESRLVGTHHILAPELVERARAGQSQRFNEKTEVFSLGVAIAEVLDVNERLGTDNLLVFTKRLIENPHSPRVISAENFIPEHWHYPLENKAISEEIIHFLHRMTHQHPDKRPTLQECREYFSQVRQQLIASLSNEQRYRHNTIGMLNLDEYMQTDEAQKQHMINMLKAFSEIWIIDADKQHAAHYESIGRRLKEEHVPITHRLFHNPLDASEKMTGQALFEKIKSAMQVTMPGYDFQYVTPTPPKPKASAAAAASASIQDVEEVEQTELLVKNTKPKKNLSQVTVPERKQKKMKKNAEPTIIKVVHFREREVNEILVMLEKERDRLIKKYKIEHSRSLLNGKRKPANVAEKRTVAIQKLIKKLNASNEAKEKISFENMINDLTELEARMTTTSEMTKTFAGFQYNITTGAKSIAEIRDKVISIQLASNRYPQYFARKRR